MNRAIRSKAHKDYLQQEYDRALREYCVLSQAVPQPEKRMKLLEQRLARLRWMFSLLEAREEKEPTA